MEALWYFHRWPRKEDILSKTTGDKARPLSRRSCLFLLIASAALCCLLPSGRGGLAEDLGPLAQPRWISLTQAGWTVSLKWFRVQGAVGYAVYRRDGEAGEFRELARTENPAYDDLKVAAGQVYFYRFAARGRTGEEGPPSEVRYIVMPKAEEEALAPPVLGIARPTTQGIAVSWSHRAPQGVLAYNLFRREGTDGEFQLLTSTVETTFLDRGVETGRTYSYAVSAIGRTLKESTRSQPLAVENRLAGRADRAASPFSSVRTLDEVVVRTERVRTLTWEEYGFVSPVDVEYLPSAQLLFVADAGTGLVTAINARGEVVASMGGRGSGPSEFDRLTGLAVDASGAVYAVDAYRGEVVLFDSRYQFLARVSLREKVEKHFGVDFRLRFPAFRFGLSDICLGPDGTLLVADNPSGWIYVLDGSNNLVKVLGGRGDGPGQMNYPTFLLMDWLDRIVVSDSLNSRVQILDLDGNAELTLGERGLGIGQFIRPKGLAIDATGNLYVSDSFLNAVQVFTSYGDYVGLLGDPDGLPLDLGLVAGMAFAEPDLLVVCGQLSRGIQFLRVPLDALRPRVILAAGGATTPGGAARRATGRTRLQSQAVEASEAMEKVKALSPDGGVTRITFPMFTAGSSALLQGAFPVVFEISRLARQGGLEVEVEVLAVDPSTRKASLALGQERIASLKAALREEAGALRFIPMASLPAGESSDRLDVRARRRP